MRECNFKKQIAFTKVFFLFVVIMMVLSACNEQEKDLGKGTHGTEPLSSEGISAIEYATQERTNYEDALRATNVIDGKKLVLDSNYLLRFPDAPTEYLSDVVVYVDAGDDSRQPTYIFIAKVEEEERNADIQSALLDGFSSQPRMDDASISSEVAFANGYVIAVAANNASDIVNKYVTEAGEGKPESSAEIYIMLSNTGNQ